MKTVIMKEHEFLYKEREDGIEIVGYVGSDEEASLPKFIQGKKVVSIGVSGMGNMKGIKITIPDSVKEIDLEAVSNRNPKGFEGPDKYSWILEMDVNNNNPYFTVVEHILYTKDLKKVIFNFNYKATSVHLPDTVEIIGEYAFSRKLGMFEWPALLEINLPDSLKKIEANAFFNCKKIKEITIPSGVEVIDREAFNKNTKIRVDGDETQLGMNVAGEVEIRETNKNYVVENGFLLSIDRKRLLKKIEQKGGFKVPSSVEEIDDDAIGKYDITLVSLNEGLKKLGHRLFVNTKISEIEIPSSVEEMEIDAFTNKNGEEIKIVLLEGNKRYYSDEIAMYRIEDDGSESIFCIINKAISIFEVQERVKELRAGLFKGCENLKKLVLNEGLTVFDESCLEWNLKKWNKDSQVTFERIYIPSSVKQIKLLDSGVNGSRELEYLISERNEHYFIDDDIVYEVDENEQYTVLFCQNKRIRRVVINEGTVEIAPYAFTSLKNSCDMNDQGFKWINKIELPGSLQIIGAYAFANCKQLESIVIPKSVCEIDDSAFWGCTGLKEILVSKENATYADMEGILTDKENKTVHIYPEGRRADTYEMPDSVTNFSQAFRNVKCIKSLVLSENIQQICNYAFPEECGIEHIYIKSDIRDIGPYVFGGLYGSKTRENAIEIFVNSEFYFNTYVISEMKSPKRNVLIVNDSDTIEMKHFKQMFSFKQVDDGLCITEFLGLSHGEKRNQTIIIPAKIGNQFVVELQENMFGQLSYGIETLIISEGIKRIGKSVLFGHSNLKKVVFPSSIEKIDMSVFADENGEYKDLYLKEEMTIVVQPNTYAEKFMREYDFENRPQVVIEGESVDYLDFIQDKDGYVAKFINRETPIDKIIVPAKYKNNPVHKLILAEQLWDSIPETVVEIFIPMTVTEIIGLEKMNFRGNYKNGTVAISVEDGNEAYWTDGIALYTADKRRLIKLIDYTVDKYEVVEGVHVISNAAFNKCTNLSKIVLPNTLTTIEESAFKLCQNLKEILGGEQVISVGEDIIAGTALLGKTEFAIVGKTLLNYSGKRKKAIVPDGIETVGPNAFMMPILGNVKDKLEEVVLPMSIKTIGKYAFSKRTQLKKINLPEGLQKIEANALSDCELLTSLIIPSTLLEIEEGAFPNKGFAEGKLALTNISVVEGNERYCECENILYKKDMSEILYVPAEAKIRELVIPKTVKKINGFKNNYVQKIVVMGELENFEFTCPNLESFEFTSEQKMIPTLAFCGCTKLENVVWPKNLQVIGSFAFCNTGLKQVKLPKTVEVICDHAFAKTKIKTFEIPSSVKLIGNTIVSGKIETVILHDNICADFFEYSRFIGASENEIESYVQTYSMVKFIGGNRLSADKWNEYRIVVIDSLSGEELYYVDMPSSKGSEGDCNAIWESWTKGAEFDFARADGCFNEMQEIKLKYAIARLHMLETLDERTKKMFVDYLEQECEMVICSLIAAKDIKELQYLEQYNLVNKKNIDKFILYAESKKLKKIVEYFSTYKNTRIL